MEINEILQKNNKKYFDAKHNCYAYRIMEQDSILERSSDDGEPSKTAGLPMLDILRGKEIINTLVIVTRYFGGILLGTGGLVRAYSDSCNLALEKSKIKNIQIVNKYIAELQYQEVSKLKYLCNKEKILIKNEIYNQNVNLEIYANLSQIKKITNQIQFINIKMISKNIVI